MRPEKSNAERVFAALADFGAPLEGLTEADFRSSPSQIFQIGVEPDRVNVLQDIGGVAFKAAWQSRVQGRIDQQITVPFLSREDLIASKKHAGRARDLADIEELREVDRVRKKLGRKPGIARTELLGEGGKV